MKLCEMSLEELRRAYAATCRVAGENSQSARLLAREIALRELGKCGQLGDGAAGHRKESGDAK